MNLGFSGPIAESVGVVVNVRAVIEVFEHRHRDKQLKELLDIEGGIVPDLYRLAILMKLSRCLDRKVQ